MLITAKLKKTLNTGVKWLIVGLAGWFIYRQVFVSGDFSSFSRFVVQNLTSGNFLLPFGLAFMLMPMNWGLEALKWQRLIRYVEPVGFGQALKSVFTGITVSLFTPNRVGDFFGRIFTLKKANPIKSALLTIVGSISQLMITLITGMLALLFYLPEYVKPFATLQPLIYLAIVVFVLIVCVLMMLFYFEVPIITNRLNLLIKPEWRRIHLYLNVVRQVQRTDLMKVMLLSLVRYIIFSGQFYLLLVAFNLQMPYFEAIMLISMTYFVMAAIPTIALVDLGIRGSVAMYFIGQYFVGGPLVASAILSATTLIWIINLALPAIFGVLFIGRLNFVRKRETNGA